MNMIWSQILNNTIYDKINSYDNSGSRVFHHLSIRNSISHLSLK